MTADDKEKTREQLQKRQQVINKKYESEGLTDEILDMQVELNTERNQLDISDETKRIYKNFVQ